MGICQSKKNRLIVNEINPINIHNNNDKLISKDINQENYNKNAKKIISNENFNENINITKKEISVIFKIPKESFFFPIGWSGDYKNYGYPIPCYNIDDFSEIEEELYRNFPDLKEEKIIYNLNDIEIDKSTSLIRNNIKDNTIITIIILERNMININFISDKPKIKYLISCYDSNIFSTIENKFYNVFPQLKEKNILFQVDGTRVNKSLSLEQNNIKDNTNINMLISDSIKIIVTFNSSDQTINWSLACNDSDIFKTIEKKLYNKFPELKKEYYFFSNGEIIDKSLTLKQNKIANKTIILFSEVDEDINNRDKLIAVIFNSIDKNINYSIPCYIYDIFSKVEKKLYEKHPNLKEKNIIFKVNGKIINKSMTLEQNNIKNGANILIIDRSKEDIDEKKKLISVMFVSVDQTVQHAIACHIYDEFSVVKEKLFNVYPELRIREVYFLAVGRIVKESMTLKENKIKNGTKILITYFD